MGRLGRYFAEEPEAQIHIGVNASLTNIGRLMEYYF